MGIVNKKKLVIGLLGAVINNGNMGCVALTFSLIKTLEIVSEELDTQFTYIVFEDVPNDMTAKKVCESLGLSEGQVVSEPIAHLYRLRRMVKYPLRSIRTIQIIGHCDLFIDLTAGDSFSDIYGQLRFEGATNVKCLVERIGKCLILGPQTYGPFNVEKNLKRALSVINRAECVLSRDQESADYLKQYTDKGITVVTDLAFELPYEKIDNAHADRVIKVGINISSLLIRDKTESTQIHFKLKADYDKYIDSLLEFMSKDPKYEVHIIPHVGEDGGFAFKNRYPGLIYTGKFADPISAKNYIAGMDIFIGSRMHATIAAFSSGVATIPVAYSRKFTGLFNHLGYEFVVDLAALDTEEAVQKTLRYVNDYKTLCSASAVSLDVASGESRRMYQVMKEAISENLM